MAFKMEEKSRDVFHDYWVVFFLIGVLGVLTYFWMLIAMGIWGKLFCDPTVRGQMNSDLLFFFLEKICSYTKALAVILSVISLKKFLFRGAAK